MAQFQFKEGLILDFGTVQFEVYPDSPDFIETVEFESNRLQEISRKQRAIGKPDSTVIRESCQDALASIDAIIGEGAGVEIFAGRTVCFFDIVDIISYIVEENNAYWQRRPNEAIPPAINRAQKRTAAKATKPASKKE